MNAQIEQWNGIGSSKAVSCSYKKLIYYKGATTDWCGNVAVTVSWFWKPSWIYREKIKLIL